MSPLRHEFFLDSIKTIQFTNEVYRKKQINKTVLFQHYVIQIIADGLCNITLFSFYNLNTTDSPGEENGQSNEERKEALLILVISEEANQT